jgi:hypothetical protein
MTINIEGTGTSIDLTIFRSCSLNDRMRMVTFTYQPQGGDSDVTFPLLFSSRTEARRFWNGYRKAQERNGRSTMSEASKYPSAWSSTTGSSGTHT